MKSLEEMILSESFHFFYKLLLELRKFTLKFTNLNTKKNIPYFIYVVIFYLISRSKKPCSSWLYARL